jgi:hypothetical protein
LNRGRNLLEDPAGTLRPNLIGDPNSPGKDDPAVGVRQTGAIHLRVAIAHVPQHPRAGHQAVEHHVRQKLPLRRTVPLQFWWEMLDAFNTPVFVLPATSFGGGSFGVIITADAT